MEEKNIREILNDIDELMANGLDENFHFLNQEITTLIASQITKIQNEFKDKNTKLYKRFRIVTNAFEIANNGETTDAIQVVDSQNYFKWLQEEKLLASGKRIYIQDAFKLKNLAEITGHDINSRVAEVIEKSDIPRISSNNLLPKKISWFDRFKAKLNKFFYGKTERKVEKSEPVVTQQEDKEGKKESFVAGIKQENITKVEKKPEIIVISDLHGNMKKWQYVKKVLKKNPNLRLIIEGDAMDRGPYGLQILLQIKELCDQGIAEYMPGNHDAFAYNCLRTQGTECEDSKIAKAARKTWENNGGKNTIQNFENFEINMQNELRLGNISKPIDKKTLIAWLGHRPIQKVITEGGKRYALGHALFDEELYRADPTFNLEKALIMALQGKQDTKVFKKYMNSMWYREENSKTHYAPIAFPEGYVMVVGHTKQKETKVKYLEGKSEQPVVYIDCGNGELQGFNLTTGTHIQIEPKTQVR